MKKITLFIATLLVVGVAQASESFKFSADKSSTMNFNNSEPIAFVERGVAFYVFLDGQFDFNTEPSRGDILYRQGRRSVNGSFGNIPSNFGGVPVAYDNGGRIRRIGNVFINYDFQNRIKRIGSVNIFYNRFALTQVGGLRLIYNRFGEIVDAIGSVNGRWNTQYGPNHNPNFGGGGFGNNNCDDNDTYYGNGNGQYQSPNNDDDDGYLFKKSNKNSDKKTEENPATPRGNSGRR